MGTFTSVIPQDAFATFAPTPLPGGALTVCTAGGQGFFDDTHVILTPALTDNPVGTGTDVIVAITFTGPLGSLAAVNTGVVVLVDKATDTVATPSRPLVAANDMTIPKIFASAAFPNVADGTYNAVFCMEVASEGTKFPGTALGVKHSSVSNDIILDRTPPVVTPPPDLTIIPTNNNPIPVTDPRIQEFLLPGLDGLPSATDVNPPNPVITNDNTNLLFQINTMTLVTFSATDDFGNTDTAQATITIGVPPPTAGCNGRMLDQSGATQEIEVCLDVPVRQAVCVLEILGGGALPYGTLNQGETSAGISLSIRNSGNAPAEIKVIAGDRNPLNLIDGFWLEPTEAGAPPFTARMIAAQTHMGVVDPNLSILGLAGFYDGPNSFPVSDTQRTILIPILDSLQTVETFFQLRINLLQALFFGDMQQTLTLQLQECSTANTCQTLGTPCPETGDLRP